LLPNLLSPKIIGHSMPNHKDDKTKDFFIAIIPPSPVYEEVWKLKQYFQEKYSSKASLNSPPHITLHMPFRWKAQKEESLVEELESFFKPFDPFKICLDNFASFPPRAIFINVAKSLELENLQQSLQRFCKKELNLFNANYQDGPFHPHVTLAFRDLDKNEYKHAWEEFKSKEYKAEFVADKIALLKHDGKTWHVFKNFNLQSSYSTDNKSALATTEG
jgi:2'-5' RNA ligase